MLYSFHRSCMLSFCCFVTCIVSFACATDLCRATSSRSASWSGNGLNPVSVKPTVSGWQKRPWKGLVCFRQARWSISSPIASDSQRAWWGYRDLDGKHTKKSYRWGFFFSPWYLKGPTLCWCKFHPSFKTWHSFRRLRRPWQYNEQINEYYVIVDDTTLLKKSDTTIHTEETDLGESWIDYIIEGVHHFQLHVVWCVDKDDPMPDFDLHDQNINHLHIPNTIAQRCLDQDKFLKKPPSGLPDNHVNIPDPVPGPEVVGSKDGVM